MPSTATTRNRLEKQGTGENSGTWGTELNASLDRIDESLDGVEAFTLSGSKTLTSTNFDDDEARERILKITGGTGGTITIPAVEKWYWVSNGSSGDVTITVGSGATAVVKSGNVMAVYSDGTDCALCLVSDFGSVVPKTSGSPTVGSHLVNKTYVDNLSFSSSLPSQSGNSGKWITTNGSAASWAAIALANISDMSANAQTFNAAANYAAMRTALGLGDASTLNLANQAEAEAGTATNKLMTPERTAQALAALASGVDWTQIASTSASGASVSFTNLSSYNDLKLVVNAVSHNHGSNQTLDIQLSANNGSSYGSALTVSAAIAAASAWTGSLCFARAGGMQIWGLVGASSTQASTTSGFTAYSMATIDAIQFVPSAGSFDNGTFTLYGR